MSSAIRTAGLTRRFDGLVAVDHLDLEVESGEIFGLLGPNGAGKSTAIKMLTTLLPPTSGDAWVAGCDVNRQAAEVRRRIGYVPQLLSADGALTARENLLLSARLHAIPRRECAARITRALEFMSLADVGDALVKTYSGGMIRRLEIAQALLHRPAVLFLDEPTLGLDPLAKHAVHERLEELGRHHMTVLVTTHDMEEADELCHRVAVMHAGRVAALGTPSELKAQVGAGATLEDVFAHFAGGAIESEGAYRDIRRARDTATRLG